MAGHEERMEKEKAPPPESQARGPMSVVVERLGDRNARVSGDMSKETLRELLMSSIMLLPTVQSSTSTGYQDMLDARRRTDSDVGLGRRQKGRIWHKGRDYKYPRRHKKKKTRGKVRDDSTWYTDAGLDFYGERSIEEESDKDKEKEPEVESLQTCPSTSTEDLELSYDGLWLRSNMRIPLRMAFKEIVAKKPYDPVAYLGFWLLNYKKCKEDSKRQTEMDDELCRLRCLIKQPSPEGTIQDLDMIQGEEEGEEENKEEIEWNPE